MNEKENIEIVQKAYENFKTGNIQSILDSLADDVNWELPEIENVGFSGRRQGREKVAEFFAGVAEAQEPLAFNPQEFVAQGDKVVALGNYNWRVNANGREFGGDWAHVWTIRDGKVVGFKEYTDTAAASAAHRKAASA